MVPAAFLARMRAFEDLDLDAFCAALDAPAVRGLRGLADFESEANLAQINARLLPGLETIFLMTKPEHACVSSSAVREAALFGADYSSFVPACILADVKQYFDHHIQHRICV